MEKIVVSLFAGLLLLGTASTLDVSTASADSSATATEQSPSENYVVFMITGNASVYGPNGMDLKMPAPISNKSYQVSTKDIVTLKDGTVLYPINNDNQYVKSTEVEVAQNNEEPADNYIAFMITGNAPVYSPTGMDLKMLAPISNKNYEVSTKDIIKLDDGTYLYPINDFNQYVKSTDVEQALNSETPIQWKTTPLDTIVHTKDLIGIPLYDQDGNIIEYQALGADSYWYTDKKIENPKTGEVFYRVSTNEYVSSVDII
ncbi:SLAP domain-containing protein [Companilactobacillus ginsenosidimutans]|uniref:Uncharacterized protein n=1 Tax=Companilactobacillus ginsenosidimutans TaxID=1007676 RepID=A0A0H4QLL5_9LACO|nr:SLAP domain-containing protein [Companilactobacillus ginsenosidimutans]AKP67981.1 hypothetical protein ABM34_10850 [Companilactobacillus ginsenosidimutans]